MSANNRLTLAVHSLVWIVLHAQDSDELATSEQISVSVNTNPVVIRRILGQLKAAGLVESRRGVGAGWYLTKDPSDITLSDVYDAIEPGALFGLHSTEPNQKCPVGHGIQPALTTVYGHADQALRSQLSTTSIADILRDVVARQRRNRRRAHR